MRARSNLQRILEARLDLSVVALLLHVDEVDDDEAREIAELQLARDLFRRLEVRVERRFLDREFARRLARVDVDGDQRLGLVDHQIAARAQRHVRAEHRVQLPLDLEPREQRLRLAVLDDVAGVARHQHAHEFMSFLMRNTSGDDDLLDVLVVEVADRALDQVAFLVDEARSHRLQRQLAHALPEAQQILEVALDLLLSARSTRGADDEPHALRHLELSGDGLKALTVLRLGDLPADTAAARRIRHQHGVAAGQRQVCGERRALVAALFLDDLNQDDLPALDDFLNLVAARAAARTRRQFLQRVFGADLLNLFSLGRAVADVLNAFVLDQTTALGSVRRLQARHFGGVAFVASVITFAGFVALGTRFVALDGRLETSDCLGASLWASS